MRTWSESGKLQAAVARAAQAGARVPDVAARHGISATYAYKICRAAGVEYPSRRRAKNFEILARLLKTDETLREVAKRFACSVQRVSHVYRRARDAGIDVPVRSHGGKR